MTSSPTYAGLTAYFESVRDAFEDRTIRRGIMVVEGNTIACQTWIEGTFVRELTQSPDGPIPPNGRRIVFDLINIFQMDDDGKLVEEHVRMDNRSLLEQFRAGSPDDFRFCPTCGGRLTQPAPTREERKIVTALFCDVTG